MVIDCHGHFTTAPRALGQWRDRQIKAFEESGARLSAAELHISDDEIIAAITNGQLKLQRERGTDVSLFSPGAGKMAHHYGDEETSLAWSQVANDLIGRVCGLFPGSFVGVCQLPQSPGDALAASVRNSVTELQRCVAELGFVGCLLNPDPSDGYYQAPPLTDRVYYPLYEKMVELGVPAMLHVAMSRNPALQGTCAHYLAGDTAVFMQLCESDLFTDFPTLKFIIPHGGGAVPYHWGRYRGVMQDRVLRLGEETGQLAALSSRIAEFYEAKLQRSVDRIIGIAGPAAIIGISVVVGGLIVSVMTSLLSVSQIVAS